MKRFIKVIGVVAALLILVVGGLMVAAKILITPERVRQVVIPLAEEHLDRPVSIGEIDVRLLSGIVISDFAIGAKADGEGDFVSAESLVLRYRFWPLLRLSVVIDEARLVSPHIRVERYEDGLFNFSDLLAEAKDEDEPPDESVDPEVAEPDETDGLPIDLLVNQISISGGRLIFTDRMMGQEYQLTELSAGVTDFSPDRPFPFQLAAKVNNAPIDIDGTVTPEIMHVVANLRVQSLDVAAFMPYAPDDFPGKLSSMKLSLDIRAEATEETVDSSGRITISEIDLLLDEMPDAPIENGRAALDYDVFVDLVRENITITRADADINGILLAASGEVLSYGEAPSLDLSARLPMIALGDVIAAVPPKLVEPIIEMQLAGRIGADVHLKGAADKPEALLEKGEITLENVGATINGITPEISGGVNVARDSVAGDSAAAGASLSYLFDLSARLNNAPIDIDGTINTDTMDVAANARVQDLDMAAFMPLAPDDFPGKLSSMKLSLDIRAAATEETVDSSGRITISEIDLLLDEMPDAPIENGRAAFDYDVFVDLVRENITITRADADINGILLAASGEVLSYGEAPSLDISARLPMISLAEVIAAVPPKLAEPLIEMQPSGRIGADVHLKGAADKPEGLIEKGTITFEKAGVTLNALTSEISGGINIAKDTAVSDNLVILLSGDPVYMDFSGDNLMGETINIKHTITADKLDIDKLLDALGVEADDPVAPVEEVPDEPAEPEEPGPFDLPLAVDGEVRIGNAVVRGLDIDGFDLRYQLKDNILTVDRLRGNVAGGSISGTARAELNRKPIAYTASLGIDATRTETILNALFPAAANTVYGTVFLNADIEGEGATWDVISRSLTSRSDLRITDGRLTGDGLASGFAGFLDARNLEVLGFDFFEGDLELENGQFQLDSRFESDDVRMAPEGTIGLDASIDLALDLRVSPGLASDIGTGDAYSRFARTGEGWTLIPIKVGGTLRSPRFDVDSSAVADQLRERGEEELRQQFQDRVLDRFVPRDSDEKDEEADRKERSPVEKEMEDAIRRLFN